MTLPKKLVVCGDSFNSISEQLTSDSLSTYANTHWSEIVSQRLGYDLTNFACPGSSNTLIVLQILEAIEKQPNLIIVGWSAGHGTRVEYFIKDDDKVSATSLGDFKYDHRSHPYLKLNKAHKQAVLSTSLTDMPHKKLSEELAMVLPFNLMGKKDEWIIMYALTKLVKSGIPFLVFERPPSWPEDWPSPFTNEMLEYCPRENIIMRSDFNPYIYQAGHSGSPCYHTSTESQILIADYLEQRINEYKS